MRSRFGWYAAGQFAECHDASRDGAWAAGGKPAPALQSEDAEE